MEVTMKQLKSTLYYEKLLNTKNYIIHSENMYRILACPLAVQSTRYVQHNYGDTPESFTVQSLQTGTD